MKVEKYYPLELIAAKIFDIPKNDITEIKDKDYIVKYGICKIIYDNPWREKKYFIYLLRMDHNDWRFFFGIVYDADGDTISSSQLRLIIMRKIGII